MPHHCCDGGYRNSRKLQLNDSFYESWFTSLAQIHQGQTIQLSRCSMIW